MQIFVWGEEFHTGIGKIDEQHHGLIDLFNRLGEAMVGINVADIPAPHRLADRGW